jgi:PHD/YefM family antitoxin component YafN of YafNO toxin-antitoxin module
MNLIVRKILMTKHTLSISEAQKELTRLPDRLLEEADTVTVTRYGKPVMAILPFDAYQAMRSTIETLQEKIQALQETLEILQDKELMAAFRRGLQDIEEGKVQLWEEVKKELELE